MMESVLIFTSISVMCLYGKCITRALWVGFNDILSDSFGSFSCSGPLFWTFSVKKCQVGIIRKKFYCYCQIQGLTNQNLIYLCGK